MEEKSFYEFYRVTDEIIGRGSFSVVRKGICKPSGKAVAVKVVDKNDINALHLERLKSELDILKTVDGCNEIVSLLDSYEDGEHLYLIFELIDGESLQDLAIDTVPYPERNAASILKSILHGIDYCHARGIVHRDMKPENLLCSYDFSEVKLVDFGLASFLNPGETMLGTVGTRSYLSPEMILKQPYDYAVDMWSIGCIAYVLLGGYHPFSEISDTPLYTQIVTGAWEFDAASWGGISDTAKDFVTQLLTLEPKDRMTASEALKHPFIARVTRATCF